VTGRPDGAQDAPEAAQSEAAQSEAAQSEAAQSEAAQSEAAAALARGSSLLELVRVMDVLRRNCPWDARQTHSSLTPYLLEETYEAVDALAAGDDAAIAEELGDVLLQVVFHARVAQERTDGTGYDIDDVADGIISKLTRRHPHVFGDVSVSGPDEVTQNWDAIKAAERAAKRATPGAGGADERPSALDGVPMSQPALSLAAQLLRRAEKAGAPAALADTPAREGASAPAGGASGQLMGRDVGSAAPLAAADPTSRPIEADDPGEAGEIGRELLALVNRARAAGIDPELELRAAALAYAERVRAWEAGAG
jgi:XTP/dITP diphosphohydrolase